MDTSSSIAQFVIGVALSILLIDRIDSWLGERRFRWFRTRSIGSGTSSPGPAAIGVPKTWQGWLVAAVIAAGVLVSFAIAGVVARFIIWYYYSARRLLIGA